MVPRSRYMMIHADQGWSVRDAPYLPISGDVSFWTTAIDGLFLSPGAWHYQDRDSWKDIYGCGDPRQQCAVKSQVSQRIPADPSGSQRIPADAWSGDCESSGWGWAIPPNPMRRPTWRRKKAEVELWSATRLWCCHVMSCCIKDHQCTGVCFAMLPHFLGQSDCGIP